MLKRRTDLAVEATQLWQEQAGETTQLRGVPGQGQRAGGLQGHDCAYPGRKRRPGPGQAGGDLYHGGAGWPAAPGGGRVSTGGPGTGRRSCAACWT